MWIIVAPPDAGGGATSRRAPRRLRSNRGGSFMAGTDKAAMPSSPARYATDYVPLLDGSPAMREIRTLIESVADTDATVLIRGESGGGKNHVGRSNHSRHHRASAPVARVHLPE